MNANQILDLTPDQIATLSAADLPAAVDAAIRLDRRITADEALLDQLKARIKSEAAEQLQQLGHAQLAGLTWTVAGAGGESAKVSFPKPGLIRVPFFFLDDKRVAYITKDKELKPLGNVKRKAGKHFKTLFMACFKPAEGFRNLAKALLPERSAQDLVAMLEEASAPKVSFDTKTKAAPSQPPATCQP